MSHFCYIFSTYFSNPFLFSRGPVEATRQAHHLILTLIKDPECDINDHLPRTKPSFSSPTSHLALFNSPMAFTETTTHVSTSLAQVPIFTLSSNVHSYPQPIPTSREFAHSRSSLEKRTPPASTAASSSHLPGNVRWASPTYQPPAKAPQTVDMIPAMTTAVSESQPIAVGKVAKANRSPAARQLVFAKATSPVTVPTTTTTRVTTTYSELRNTRPLSYSKVAGGVVPSSATVEGQVEDGLHGTSLPPVISNILSQVGQTRSPIVWNEMFYASTRQNCNENEEPKETGSNESHEVSQQPLTVSTPGGLFKPLPHEVSPPNPSGASPASSSSPTLNATPSPPAALSSATEDSEKPCIRPIGTERAHWRTNTSPSTTLGGVVPLISTGKLVCRTQVKVAQGVSTLLDDQ